MFYAEFIGQAVAERAVAQQVEVDQAEFGLELRFGAQQTTFSGAADAATGAVLEKKNGVLIRRCQQFMELGITFEGYPAHGSGVLAGRGRGLTESRASIAVA